jgi:L-ascorbate metabolism protein UlaG (beta-lactamase superfamily)
VGTATVILRFGGITILTDPNFLHQGDHVHLGYGLTSRRLTEPAIDISALPPIDLVLLSHLHEDHFDRLVEKELDKSLPILTTPEAARSLRAKGFREARGLETWETALVDKGDVILRVTSMPGRHGPGPIDHLLPDVMGAMLEYVRAEEPAALRLYVSGDTLVHQQLREIPLRYPEIDLGLFHLGGTRVLGVLVTMDARQGITALRLIGPRMTVPIHYDDYDVFKSPLEDFVAAVREAGLEANVTYLSRGQTFVFRPRELRALPPVEKRAYAPERPAGRWAALMLGGMAAIAATVVFARWRRHRAEHALAARLVEQIFRRLPQALRGST